MQNFQNKSAIRMIKQISKPSRRIYSSSKDLTNFKNCIISTNRGLLTSKKAFKNNLGGEIIIKILFYL